jgi:hypothetical protein
LKEVKGREKRWCGGQEGIYKENSNTNRRAVKEILVETWRSRVVIQTLPQMRIKKSWQTSESWVEFALEKLKMQQV